MVGMVAPVGVRGCVERVLRQATPRQAQRGEWRGELDAMGGETMAAVTTGDA